MCVSLEPPFPPQGRKKVEKQREIHTIGFVVKAILIYKPITMARTKTVKVEEKVSSVVEQKEPEMETEVEVDNSSAEEEINSEINSDNGEVIVWAKCVEGWEPEIILWQTKPEEDLPVNWVVDGELDENEVKPNEEEEKEEEKPAETNFTAGIASTVVNDPIQGNRVVYQPQVGTNNFDTTQCARWENGRRGEIIKRV